MERWDDTEAVLREEARLDLERTGAVGPALVAFAGDHPLFLAFLRPFRRGHYHDPVIELLALAMPLGANRLAMSVPGRITSLEDPIAPVVPGVGDLRQRGVIISRADAMGCGPGGEPVVEQVIWPYELLAGAVRWGPPLRTRDGAGWIIDAIRIAAAHGGELPRVTPQARRQLRRCQRLGHDILASPRMLRDLMAPARAAEAGSDDG
jgi:hypothetical protein